MSSEWILGGQFLQTTYTIQGREGESIDIAGFDAATKTYRCWHFDADCRLERAGHRHLG